MQERDLGQLADLREWIGVVLRYRSEHPASQRILDTLERIIDRPYRTHALIHGEAGTGKEGLARALHLAMHPEGHAPFVKVPSGGRDAAVLGRHLFGTREVPGAIARAEHGTLFLDEVATMPREVQARLAPVLRDRYRRDDDETPVPCHVCVIGASDHDVRALVETGDFRHDLYYRLTRIELLVPPLRERPDDVVQAALWTGNRVLRTHGETRTLVLEAQAEPGDLVLEDGAVQRLVAAPWEGNFRELDRVMERALMLYRDGARLDAAAIDAALEPPDRKAAPRS